LVRSVYVRTYYSIYVLRTSMRRCAFGATTNPGRCGESRLGAIARGAALLRLKALPVSYAGLSLAFLSPGLRENRRAPRNPSGFRRPAGHEPGLRPDTNSFTPHLLCIRYSRIERSCVAPFSHRAYRLSRTERSCAIPRAASQQLQDHLLLRSESPTTRSKDHKTVLLLRSKIDRQVKG